MIKNLNVTSATYSVGVDHLDSYSLVKVGMWEKLSSQRPLFLFFLLDDRVERTSLFS
jgi:hypothetical protein